MINPKTRQLIIEKFGFDKFHDMYLTKTDENTSKSYYTLAKVMWMMNIEYNDCTSALAFLKTDDQSYSVFLPLNLWVPKQS